MSEPLNSKRRQIWRPFRSGPLDRPIQWLVSHVRGLHKEVGVFLFVGFLLTLLAGILFLGLAEVVMEGWTRQMDEAAVEWLRENRTPPLDYLALAGAALGSGVAAWAILIIGGIWLWWKRHHYSAALLWVSVLGGRALSSTLKAIYDRPRPDPLGYEEMSILGYEVTFPSSASFPSGHAITSVVLFGTFAYLLMRLEPTLLARRLTLALTALLILLIGLSRIYMGVHYPSDVIAGYLTGSLWATFSVLALEVIRYVARLRPEVARHEEGIEQGVKPIRETMRGGSS